MPNDPENLVELLRGRANERAEERAYTFLVDGEENELHLTYGQLDERVRAVAARLQQLGLEGERALLLYPQGLDYVVAFFACLYAGVIAVPAYPPGQNRNLLRIRAIVDDARPSIVLTLAEERRRIEKRFGEDSELGDLEWLATDELGLEEASAWRPVWIARRSLAFLQYTSGSTSTPKGVMVSHGNLLQNLSLLDAGWRHDRSSVLVSWLPIFHDMGLIYGVLEPVWSGFRCILMAPVAFLQKPFRWLSAVSRYRASHSIGPNFAYELCVERISAAERTQLDLSAWDVAVNGAEPVRPETLDRFAAAFAPSGFKASSFCPGYGLAEGTLKVTASRRGEAPLFLSFDSEALEQHRVRPVEPGAAGARRLVGCGSPELDVEVVIADPATRERSAQDAVGEVWVGGASVAGGYWQRREESAETFTARLADGSEGTYLRTGDLGFLAGGELFVTGRIKDLLIIRGRNHYPQDIEATAEASHPSLRSDGSAAFALTVDSEERLALVAEVETRRGLDLQAVLAAIREAVLGEHELQPQAIVLLRARTLPKTSSGKIQRQACRQAFLAGELHEVARWTATDGGAAVAEGGSEPAAATAVEAWLVAWFAQRLGLAATILDRRRPFAHFGLESQQMVGLSGELAAALDRDLPPTLLYDHPTIAALARHLAGAPSLRREPATAAWNEPIALLGMSCRFPGGASDPEAFWQLLAAGGDAIVEVPAERWPVDELLAAGRPVSRWGGFLADVEFFDAEFFGLSPREAMSLDPQQRLLLEVAWEALEDAAQPIDALAGSRTGVFVGLSGHDYSLRWLRSGRGERIDPYYGTGNTASVAAGRLSFLLGLTGPSLAIDTACSSALVAVHLACQSLRSGESDLALAAGVNLILSPEGTLYFSLLELMAADGRCKTFSADADGYVRSEGCGVVVLKRLRDAQADGDPILAVLRGTAAGHGGHSNGLTAPNGPAQVALIRECLRQAGVQPHEVDYVEAHSTGTVLGDPIELHALGEALGEGRAAGEPLRVGSVKTNVGHLEAASGMAGLIKTVLALRHGMIPRNLHFREANPHVDWQRLPLTVPRENLAWPAREDRPRLAGVSSFGFSGTQAHVLVADAPLGANLEAAPVLASPVVLPLSARSPEALAALARRYYQALTTGSLVQVPLIDLTYTAALRRTHHPSRLAVLGSTADELAAGLAAFVAGEAHPGLVLPAENGPETNLPLPRRIAVGYVLGQPVEWHRLFPQGGRPVPLPAYPWQRQRYWVEEPGTGARLQSPGEEPGNPALVSSAETLRERLLAATERLPLVEELCRQQVAQSLKVEPEKVERDIPLARYGLDSVIGIEVRGRLEQALGVLLPTTVLWQKPTLAELAEFLHEAWVEAQLVESFRGASRGGDTSGDDFEEIEI